MAFKRAEWHSGLTYRQTCENCNTIVEYTDYHLDFRPWYADGFVDCPKCKSHLRHNEKYAINAPKEPEVITLAGAASSKTEKNEPTAEAKADAASAPTADQASGKTLFCTGCGKRFGDEDRFCSMCGKKRD